MKLIPIVASALLVALAGCATVPNPVHQNVVYGAAATYGIVQTAIKTYGHLPFCAPGTTTSATNYCQDPAVEVKLANANASVSIARKALESFVRNPANYPGLTYAQLYKAYQDAQAALSQIAAQNGVH